MQEVSVVIPNFNGMAYLDGVLSSLERQTIRNFEVILVDNGSTDGSCAFVSAEYPWVHMIQLPENYGFSRAVNEGIHAARSPYVLLLNNDTEAEPDFLEEMVAALRRHKKAFSCQAKMIQLHDHDKMDDAGNYYCALGWSFARGRGKDIHAYETEDKIFSACAGAAIYRKKIIEKIGYFDEEHFAYLEDTDIGYRARIYGYENWYAPKAIVYHVGSGTSGSRYNQFKTRYSSRNNISLPVTVKYSMNFIPVKIRIFHSNYRLHISKLLQKPLYLILFLFKLCGIRHTLILAPTALFCVWTDCLCFFLFHKFSLIFILLFVLHNI